MEKQETVVEMRGVTKRFPGVVANDSVSFQVRKGEIHALLGENGAGKSTLMNILFGLYEPDEGEVFVNGQKVDAFDPNKANRLGIGMVHQHFMLIEPFSVVQNIILGAEPTRGTRIDEKKAEQEIVALSEQYHLRIDPRAKIRDISVGMQQRIEILKILYRGADILIFDEPTAVLTPDEIQELIQIMRTLIREGKTIILITHKLKEVMEVCDRVTIIRRGKVVDSLSVSETNTDELAAKMVGRRVHFAVEKKEAQPRETVLEVKNVCARDNRGVQALNHISFHVRAGEILGIAGVDGNGQSELVEAISGLRKTDAGEILLKGRPIHRLGPREVSEAGVGHIPEDRQKRGLVLDFTMAENLMLKNYYRPPFQRRGWMQYDEASAYAERLIKQYDVRTPDASTPAKFLSGGNQQKAIIAREVENDPDLLIAAQPTRGLDVGAIEFIHKRLVEQRDKGKAILLVSLELDELLTVSDRIAVIYEGTIVGFADPKETDERELGLLMAGGKAAAGGSSS